MKRNKFHNSLRKRKIDTRRLSSTLIDVFISISKLVQPMVFLSEHKNKMLHPNIIQKII